MGKLKNVKFKVFGSKKEYANKDLKDSTQIFKTVRDEIEVPEGVEYREVNVKVKRTADGKSPESLIVYLLRKDTYTADVVKLNVDSKYSIKDVVENYEDDDDDDDDDDVEYGADIDDDTSYAVDFVVATCCTDISSAVKAVNFIYDSARSAGLNAVRLLGSNASTGNYKYYLKSGVKGFVNIGHGHPGGIILSNGTLNASWFQNLTGKPVNPAVVYFNSCQVHNNPLLSAIMQAGARTFIGGIVNLGIGTSEEVCKCFWIKSFTSLSAMATSLKNCEKSKYPTTGAHGFTGEKGIFWLSRWWNNLSVIRAHAKSHSQMAWVVVSGSSWLRLRPNAPDGISNEFSILCKALANNRKVDIYVNHSQIEQVTLR